MANPSYILTTSAPDTTGIVAAVSGFLAERRLSITESHHFLDPPTNRSYLRTEFRDGGAGVPPVTRLESEFRPIAAHFGMEWGIHDTSRRCRVLIGVSKTGYCLNSMLNRWQTGVLPIEVIGVFSNHEDHRRLTEWYGVPYHYLPIGADGREAQEARLMALFEAGRADLMVLARYMQVLTSATCARLAGRAINIHHSFLPGFKGARPYQQAYERGVKLIGATAHYITDDLDDGPIIEQEVERVDHSKSPEELTVIGHDIESVVLNRAVRWHAEHRVFVHGVRTVILR